MTNKTGPRAAILAYLSRNGLSTLDDIMTGIGESKRDRASSNLSAAIQDELIARKRDDVTNLPAYEITTKGKNWLTRTTGTSTPPSAPKAAAVAVRQASSTTAPTDVTEQLREIRANEQALSQTITEICCAFGADPAKTTTRELVELANKARADLEHAIQKTRSADSNGRAVHTQLLDTRQRLDDVTQQSLKDIALLTEKNRKLHEELDALRSSAASEIRPPLPANIRRATGYVVIDSSGGTTRHKRLEAANRSAARAIRAGVLRADVAAIYIVARARQGVEIKQVTA